MHTKRERLTLKADREGVRKWAQAQPRESRKDDGQVRLRRSRWPKGPTVRLTDAETARVLAKICGLSVNEFVERYS